jgi:hypothetical protein
MKHRQFYYANSNTGPLAQNGRHAFALTQSMSIFKSATCCTWIPKNACSTLRFSVAKANGCVSDLSDVNWIHTNNSTFNATTQTTFMADYTFVVLRCPLAVFTARLWINLLLSTFSRGSCAALATNGFILMT